MERRATYSSLVPDLLIEKDFGWPYKSIAGIDEAGRGPVIGPLVVGAVALPTADLGMLLQQGVKDSKD